MRTSQIKALADRGSSLASGFLKIISSTARLDSYIAACQFGITISSLILGAYGQAQLTPLLVPFFEHFGNMQVVAAHSVSAAAVVISLTVLQVILGELVPKSLALQFTVKAALYSYLPTKWTQKAFSWVIKLLNGSGLLVLKLMGVPAGRHRHIHSREEIDQLLEESREGGIMRGDELERLQSVLEFEEVRIEQIMIPDSSLSMLEVSAPVEDLIRIMSDTPRTHIPVYEGTRDKVLGILHTKNLTAKYAKTGEMPLIRSMVGEALFVPDSMTIERLLPMMRGRAVQQALVVDEFGQFAGMVTMERILGEMLGEIGDEFKPMKPKMEQLEDGRLRIAGSLRKRKANEIFRGISDMYPGAATLSGCIIRYLSRIPEPGEEFPFCGRTVVIEQVRHNMIASLVVLPEREEEPGE